jgi:hypothetical protein
MKVIPLSKVGRNLAHAVKVILIGRYIPVGIGG